jgi:thiol-disulfide isomerase/thioredoxin
VSPVTRLAGVWLLLSCAAFGDEAAFDPFVIRNAFVEAPAENAPAGAGTTAAAGDENTLRWNNNETLPGALVGATMETLLWKSPLFAEPVEIGLRHLRQVEYPAAPVVPEEVFAITMRDGSRLHGEIREINQKTVLLESARHGAVRLHREEVGDIQRLKGRGIYYSGPTGVAGWTANPTMHGHEATSNTPVLLTEKGGTLSTVYWNRSMRVPVPFKQAGVTGAGKVEVEFRLRSSARPEFMLLCRKGPAATLGKEDQNDPVRETPAEFSIENWDDDLVISIGGEFARILKLDEKTRDVALRVFWDSAEGKVLVYSMKGEKLAGLAASFANTKVNAKTPVREVSQPTSRLSDMVQLENKGPDLSVEFLRIRSWDGSVPARLDHTRPHVDLADGSSIPWMVLRGTAESLIIADAVAGTHTVSWEQVHGIVFKDDPPDHLEEHTGLWFADGGYIEGSLREIKNNEARVQTRFSDAPVHARLDTLKKIELQLKPADEKPLAQMDRLSTGKSFLHGTMDATGGGNPSWTPIGARKPVTINPQSEMEITRRPPPDGRLPRSPALFYLSSGDILPGVLKSATDAVLNIESPLFESKTLPVAVLHGVQFDTREVNPQGFADPGWRVVRGDAKLVKMMPENVIIQPGGALGHPALLQADEMKFALHYDNNSGMTAVRVRLFCNGTDASSPSTNLLFANYGSQVYCGLESTQQAGQMDEQFSLNLPDYGKAARIRLVWSATQMEFFVNEVSMRKVSIADRPRSGLGLILEPSNLWGNGDRTAQISDFSVRPAPGTVSAPTVNSEAKVHALTIPRFRREDPPRHVLIAENGDLLRGEIEGMTATHFAFRSGLEEVRVPRERVAAAIWLKKPRKGSPVNPKELTLKARVIEKLAKSSVPNYRYTSTPLMNAISLLQRQAAGPKIEVPAELKDRKVSVRFSGHSVATALELVCQSAGVTYRVQAEDKIVIEPLPAASDRLVTRSYWLKTDVFKDSAGAAAHFQKEGIPPGEDTVITYQADTELLSITHKAGMMERIGKIVDALSGGATLTPTHYFELASGACFPLAVERFDPQEVVGRHPLAGSTRVPMSQLHAIRTTQPPPGSAGKAFAEWELRFAPEPVLPETGGQNSPLLGKSAGDVKLPLLDGGEFDLAKEKGKVVVLDFWATWCGPCMKSLPEMIAAMSELPADRVRFIGVNQAESAAVVKKFLDVRGWKLEVAMDARQMAGAQFGVDGIPHTVVIGPDGRIAWVKTGYEAAGAKECADAVKKLLTPQ